MVITNINTSSLDSFNFKDSLKKNGEETQAGDILIEDNLITPSTKLIPTSFRSVSSEGIMSRNFVGATSQSRYVEAKMSSLQSNKQMALSSRQILAEAAEKMLEDNGIDRTNTGSAAAVAAEMRRISNKKVFKTSQDNLDEIKKDIEQSAEEAIAPKDEHGEPIDISIGSSGQTSETLIFSTGSGESAVVLQNAEGAATQDTTSSHEMPSINIVV